MRPDSTGLRLPENAHEYQAAAELVATPLKHPRRKPSIFPPLLGS